MAEPEQIKRATFAAGCFWDVEAAFRRVSGVIETMTGYTGGSVPDPSYDVVESDTTRHVQAVGIVFDPAVVMYETLLDTFWDIHDPRQAGGQGDYLGTRYRSVIFFHTPEQEHAARLSRDRIAAEGRYGSGPVLTEILPAESFWPAEECHQQFYEKCGRCFGASRQIYE